MIYIYCCQRGYLKQTWAIFSSPAVSCELATVVMRQWRQTTSVGKGGCRLLGKEGPWWICGSATGQTGTSTVVLEPTAAKQTWRRPQCGGPGNTTKMERWFITIHGQCLHTGTKHISWWYELLAGIVFVWCQPISRNSVRDTQLAAMMNRAYRIAYTFTKKV